MALYFSTGLRQYIAQHSSWKRALQGGCMIIYSGTVPTNANDAAGSGTAQLVRISLNGDTYSYVAETQGSATITFTGSSGSVSSITVGKSGETAVEILGATVTYTASLTQVATDCINQINKYLSNPEYEPSSSAANLYIKPIINTGTAQNNFVVTVTTATLGSNSPQSITGGVASSYGLTYLYGVDGVMSKTGTWNGIVSNTGTAAYWRIYGPHGNEWGSPSSSTTQIRIQGTCGTSSTYDYIMASTTMTAGTGHTVDTFNLTVPAS